MARLGVAKVKTGCITCKCASTGRRCDGYVTPPTGTYSWAQLLRVHPPPTQAASDAELRALSFFRKVVAPVLSGPLDSYFWTHLVSQVSYQELAARHAALAISSLYEKVEEDRHGEKNPFAVAHYNEAIKHLRTTNNQETVLFVCILFVCIDMLRGEGKGAVEHCRHGVNILNGSKSSSRFLRDHLEPAFCRLGVFPFFFGARPDTFPSVPDLCSYPVPPLYNIEQVQGVLDPLLVRAIRFARAADGYRLGDETYPEPGPTLLQQKDDMDKMLDDWAAEFQAYLVQKSPRSCKRAAMREELMERLLEMKYLVGKIWLSTCMSRREESHDLHLDKFQRIIELGREVESTSRDRGQRIDRAKFTFEMGFSPLLGFVFIKCRSLTLRIAALGLMKTIANEKENLWDSNTVLACGRKVVEFEHELDLGPDECIADVFDDGTMPPEGRRIKDLAMQNEVRIVSGKDGAVTMWRKVAFLMREHDGPITVTKEWFRVHFKRKS
ncbi:C6 zinc finger protein [Colletotrichum orchidophilum]|uniref:C6 zinc finger protein n=1 Tax=Colletotrichum orchidophilum TaxID=1209926 RepID=A0A1G4BS63_9PEZI|nr:C6 zinc finger protein [Colletotrichum orchidophilum]OHF04264.1 C6 zinc finger protein [Colletotrichum orchidophilum]